MGSMQASDPSSTSRRLRDASKTHTLLLSNVVWLNDCACVISAAMMSRKVGCSLRPAIFFCRATTAGAAKCAFESMTHPPAAAAAVIALSMLLFDASEDPNENVRRDDTAAAGDGDDDAAATLAVISNPASDSSSSGV